MLRGGEHIIAAKLGGRLSLVARKKRWEVTLSFPTSELNKSPSVPPVSSKESQSVVTAPN